MKKIQLILLLLIAGLIASSDPYGLGDGEPQNKRKKKKETESEVIKTNQSGNGPSLQIEFKKGPEHNHPLLAIWIEDTTGKFIQTLYIARSIATGIFNYGDASSGQWKQGEIRRPAALPYWAHKRGVKSADGLYMPTPDNPVPDAYSGATPKNDFLLETKFDEPGLQNFYVLFEINQPWDWNTYWTNAKYPDDDEYKTSAQPAVVYQAAIDLSSKKKEYTMQLIGHSHFSGKTGELFEDTSTLTTSLFIAEEIKVVIK